MNGIDLNLYELYYTLINIITIIIINIMPRLERELFSLKYYISRTGQSQRDSGIPAGFRDST